MNFLTLNYFKITAEELNITHASRRLYISQQALSSHIRNIEEELGVKLFNRTPRLSLTDAGRCLYEVTREIEKIKSDLNDKLNDIREETIGEMRIGLSFTRGQFILPYILPEYSLSHPGVHIKIFEEHSKDLMDRLLRGEIDFWISAENVQIEGMETEPLFSEKFFLVVPLKVLERTYGKEKAQELKIELESSLEIEKIIDCPFILLNQGNRSRDLFDDVMRVRQLVPNIILETENSQTAFELAQKEMAVTIYSDMFLRSYSGKRNPDVMFIPLEKYIKTDVLHIFYSKDRLSGYKQSFLNEVHKVFGY